MKGGASVCLRLSTFASFRLRLLAFSPLRLLAFVCVCLRLLAFAYAPLCCAPLCVTLTVDLFRSIQSRLPQKVSPKVPQTSPEVSPFLWEAGHPLMTQSQKGHSRSNSRNVQVFLEQLSEFAGILGATLGIALTTYAM